MSNRVLVDPDILTDIADAIRAKTGESDTIAPSAMATAIGGITTGDEIDHEDLPAYVKAEARAVAARVNAKLTNDSIVFIAGSDSHQSTTAHVADGNLHGGQGMKALAYMLPLDFATFLGDYTTGSSTTTIADGLAHINAINADIDEAFRGLPQFRTVGNHDPLGYSYANNGNTALTQAQLYALIGKYNADSGATMGSTTSGYCYRDFPSKSVRVICLNTADESPSSTGGTEVVSAAQKTWFADTLISTPQDYGIIILAHHPLDWGNIMSVSHILRAYVEEQSSFVIGSTTYDFTNKNKSAWVLQFHGHVHTFKDDNLHWNNGGTGEAYDVKRASIPNMCFNRNNEYGTAASYYGIVFGTATTYNKTADSGADTAWCVVVINPSEEKAYLINYGAGIDREVYWGATAVAVEGISLTSDHSGDTSGLTATEMVKETHDNPDDMDFGFIAVYPVSSNLEPSTIQGIGLDANSPSDSISTAYGSIKLYTAASPIKMQWDGTAQGGSTIDAPLGIYDNVNGFGFAHTMGDGLDNSYLPNSIYLFTASGLSGTLQPNQTVTLTPVISPSNATNKGVLWSTSDASVATVNNGVVTAHAVGSATITATTQDGGFTATYALTVANPARGNLRDYFGYTDGKRLSTSDGTYRDKTGGTVVEYIDMSEFWTSEGIVIKTKGVNFQQVSNPYNDNAWVFYNANHSFLWAGYLSSGSNTNQSANVTVTRSFSGTDMTLTITGITASQAGNQWHYLRICGLGNGADLDIRVNEDFD